ncbi:hypothetical protein HK105_202352 [Polyrhizophydium stewartii]|uniref:Uncharacterized protein n=1 Tax=Polyrhizophydium stewartii TaxID=2732419 RepID=A0ABR4NEH8_9FUNG
MFNITVISNANSNAHSIDGDAAVSSTHVAHAFSETPELGCYDCDVSLRKYSRFIAVESRSAANESGSGITTKSDQASEQLHM